MAPTISVIIPVYNVANHVGDCIKSLRQQTWEDFEAIVVDDGSTDASANAAKDAIGDDLRFTLIKQDNGGLSRARNIGLNIARGKFISFLDSDDVIAPDFLEKLRSSLERSSADWVACAVYFKFKDGTGLSHSAIHGDADLANHKMPRRYQFRSCTDVIRHFPSAWNKLYRRKFIGALRFEEGTQFEDHLFFNQLAARTDHILHLPEPLYVQTKDREGQITTQDNDRIFEQIDVLNTLRSVLQASSHGEGELAFERLASRLVFERSTAIRRQNRRKGFAKACSAFFATNKLTYSPEWDSDIAQSWGMEMAGELPVSVVIPWNGRKIEALRTTMFSLSQLRGPLREVLLICKTHSAARRCQEEFSDAIVAQARPKRTETARALGLEMARGKYVVFLNAGDELEPFTLLNWCEAMMCDDAALGAAGYRTIKGTRVQEHSAFKSRQKPPFGPLIRGAQTAINIDPCLSSKIFRRETLLTELEAQIETSWSEIPLFLNTLFSRQCIHIEGADVTVAPPRPPSPRHLLRLIFFRKITSKVAENLQSDLPEGWQRRLFARLLKLEIDRSKTLTLPARLAWLTLMATLPLVKGFSGPTPKPAGLDADFSAKAAMILDPIGVFRYLVRLPRRLSNYDRQTQLDEKIQRKFASGRDSLGLYFPLGTRGRFRCRVSFHNHDYANIDFAIPDQLCIPFHLSFRLNEQTVVLNQRNKSGDWRREKAIPLSLTKSGADVEIQFDHKHIVVRIGEKEIIRKKRPYTSELISEIKLQGEVHPISICPDLPSGELSLDARLNLATSKPPPDSVVRIQHNNDQLPLIFSSRTDQPSSSLTHFPGRIWRNVPAGAATHFQVFDPSGKPMGAPLVITRQAMLHRIEKLLTLPVPPSDGGVALPLLEHLFHGDFFDKLSPDAQANALRLADFYNLSKQLPTISTAPTAAIGATSNESNQTAIASALARIANAPASADPINVLSKIPMTASAQKHLFLSLSELFCTQGQDFRGFFEFAQNQDFSLPTNQLQHDNPWALSASLPFLFLEHRHDDLQTALQHLANGPKYGWIVTTALAWVLRELNTGPEIPAEIRMELLRGIFKVMRSRRWDYFGRNQCAELTSATVQLINQLSTFSEEEQAEVTQFCLETYGLSRQFWEGFASLRSPNSRQLQTAHKAFECIRGALERQSADCTAELERAISYFEDLDCADAQRFRRDLFGPSESGLLSKCQAHGEVEFHRHPNSAQAALRSLAHPLSPAATNALSNFAKEGFLQITPNAGQLPKLSGNVPSTFNGLVVIFSCRANLETRLPALRKSWIKDLKELDIPFVVIVGGGDGERVGDTVFLDAPDDYEGLPAKSIAAIRWVFENTTYDFLYKIDDDCFLNAELLAETLHGRDFDYVGRPLWRGLGQTDRAWHQKKSKSDRGRFELDRSVEPSIYADGGSGYALSRKAMQAALKAAESPDGQRLLQVSFMEDKLVGDLLAMQGISLNSEGYHTAIYRRMTPNGRPVCHWQNGFLPSKSAPTVQVHMDTHEGQQTLMHRKSARGLWPKKIWPSYVDARLGYQSNALELVSSVESANRAKDAEIAVVSCVRNEIFMLPHFLKHYRNLGVECFIIADNNSDDGTLEYLLEQNDVTLFTVDTEYKHSHYGVAWQQAMISAFRVGKWSLVADADELLFWQLNPHQTLPDFLKTDAFTQAEAMRVFMLDMYPKDALSKAHFSSQSPFKDAPYCDAHPFLENWPGRGVFSDQSTWTSAVRHRLIPSARPDLFIAQKIALLRYQPWMRLSAGLHCVGDAKLTKTEAFFGHFKYNADFHAKAEAEAQRKQHFNSAEEYKKYLALMSEGQGQIYHQDLSVHWKDCPFVLKRLT